MRQADVQIAALEEGETWSVPARDFASLKNLCEPAVVSWNGKMQTV
jgi:hypothetical protein